MVEAADIGTISTDLVRILLGGSPLADGKLAEILRSIGLSAEQLNISQRRISTRDLALIWAEMERSADDPHLGLHIGELRDGLPSGHVLFSAMLNSPTLGQALKRYCRFHDIMADFVQPVLEVRGTTTVLSLSTRGRVALHPQHVECIFSLLVSTLALLSAHRPVLTVRFVHTAPTDTSEHERLLGRQISFSQPRDELVIENDFLERPIAAPDAELLGVLDEYAERLLRRIRPNRTWSAKVTDALGVMLCDGKPSQAEVARRLAVSQRSLQGKLKDEGTTYQKLLDRVRLELATGYLKDERLALAEVAFLVGFADQSAFNHAFRKWTGDTPRRFRQRRSASST